MATAPAAPTALGDTVLALSDEGTSCPALVVGLNSDGTVNLHRFVGAGISPQLNASLATSGPAAAGQYTAKP
jgi:hypothetical protein